MIPAIMGIWAVVLIAVAIRWPQHLVPAAIFCSVFEGAAIVNAGGLGISPYYFTLMLIAAHCVLLRVKAPNALGYTAGVRRIMFGAVALLVVGLGSAVVLPRVFAGWAVLSPRLNADAQAPLSFSTSNVGQSVYLLLNVAMLWYTAQTCRTEAGVRGVVNAFLLAGLVVVALAGYQLVSSTLGLPFPGDLLYSNDAYVMQSGTAILDMPRICSTFTEPSSLAVFLVTFIAFLMTQLEGSGRFGWRGALLLLCSIAALILSTSSTAYLGLAGLTAWGVWRYMLLPLLKGSGNPKAALAVAVVIGAAVTAFMASATLRDVIQTTVFDKDQSSSYEERSQADRYSMKLAEETWGLGVGLGSNRASSFLPSVMSTIGVFGAGTFGLLVVLLVLPADDAWGRARQRPLAVALVAIIGAKLISSPDLATPAMWALMTALVAVRAAADEAWTTAAIETSSGAAREIRRKHRILSPG